MSDVGTVTERQQEGASKDLDEERDAGVAVTAAEPDREVGLDDAVEWFDPAAWPPVEPPTDPFCRAPTPPRNATARSLSLGRCCVAADTEGRRGIDQGC